MTNVMKKIRIEKITINVGAGKDQNKLEKGIILIKKLTGITPIKTVTQKRIAAWGLRPGLPIGCKITLRGKKAIEVLKRLLDAKGNILDEKNFDVNGNLSFGIAEYIDVPGLNYDPKIGIMGFEVAVTLSRPGFRIKIRKIKPAKIGKNQKISKEESLEFFKTKFNIKFDKGDE